MATTSTGRSWRRSRIVAGTATALVLTGGLGSCGSSRGQVEKLGGAQLKAAIDSATAEIRAGKLDNARQDFQTILRSNPTSAAAHYNLGYIAQTQHKPAEAEQEYRAALATDPEFGPALYNLAIAVTADGRNDEAISLYRRAIAANAHDANSHYNLGLLLRVQGKTTEGTSQIRLAVKINPALAPQATAQGVPLK
jgi:Tfp pilus assembly protein PilF